MNNVFLKPICLEGGDNIYSTYIYGTVQVLKMGIYRHCLWLSHHNNQSRFVEYAKTTMASATFMRNKTKLL